MSNCSESDFMSIAAVSANFPEGRATGVLEGRFRVTGGLELVQSVDRVLEYKPEVRVAMLEKIVTEGAK